MDDLNLIEGIDNTSISAMLPPPPLNFSPEVISSVENYPNLNQDTSEINIINNNDEILINNNSSIFATQIPTTNNPTLEFSELLVGSNLEEGTAITIDDEGNTYITGSTNSIDFPISANAVQNNFAGGDEFGRGDAFVAKYSPDGTLIYATYIGGSGEDFGTDIAVDITGDIYITGNTNSVDFPTLNALQDTYGGGEFSGDAFVVKLSNDGNNILYSTYLGGIDNDISNGIAVDNNGNVYITGDTGALLRFPITPIIGAGNFPTTENALQNTLINEFNRDAFVSKISADGTELVYSTLLGGNNQDRSQDITVDNNGNAYITGETRSLDFPTVDAVQNTIGGDKDVFITQLNSDGSDLVFSTYYGGIDGDVGNSIAVDNSGNIYVGGTSSSQIIGGDAVVPPVGEFPTVNALQNTFGGGDGDGILIKINNDRSVGYATYFGGEEREYIENIGLDATGNIYMIGNTNFLLGNAYIIGTDNLADAFVSKISNDGTTVEYSTVIDTDGNFSVFGNDIAVDEVGNAYIVGVSSPGFMDHIGFINEIEVDTNTKTDAFIAKLAANTSSPGIPPFVPSAPNIPESFNESLYLTENPGVADAIANGLFNSGFEHWLELGFVEGRSPQFAFDETFYLTTYPDVADVVANSIFINGLEHYFRFGQSEGRLAIA